jgi:AcrR family transcriptional regulator
VSLRERKKARTRDRLVAEAIRLFVERGYEETSVEEIAAAADVSPRTFFRYFPTKADVALADLPLRLQALREALTDTPAVHGAVREALVGTLGLLSGDPQLLAARNRLLLENAGLRGRLLEFLDLAETVVTDAYARHSRLPPDTLAPRLAAALTVGSARAAMLTWTISGGDPERLLDRAFAVTAPTVRRALRGD